ncbi:unnamed protein product [Pedinophyceae sp. YPF-701]|nr:unnamed protein product [Pedinophyceae sp. YPF-701]
MTHTLHQACLTPARASQGLRRRSVAVFAKDRKGFGSTPTQAPAEQAKVNKRGKVTSRQGTVSPKEQKKSVEQYKEQYEEWQNAPPDLEDTELPQVVGDRMLKRIVACTGLPILVSLTVYPLFYYLKVVKDIDVPTWAVYITSSLTWGGALLGISYGVLSASWDPAREGTTLGWVEFQANLPALIDRIRSKGGR